MSVLTSVSSEQIKNEEIAKRKRDEAKNYLNSIGQSIEKVDPKKSNYNNDNTIELLLAEKRKNTNNNFTSTQQKTTTTATTADNHKTLPVNWSAVIDKSTGKTYYWNTITNETTWTSPILIKSDVSDDKTHDDNDDNKLPPHWVEKYHNATMQKYWQHEKTLVKRWTFPSNDDDGLSETVPMTKVSTENLSKKQKIIGPIGPK